MAYHILTTLASASVAIRLSAIGGLMVYFVVTYAWSIRRQRRKQQHEIEPLIRELEKIARNLKAE